MPSSRCRGATAMPRDGLRHHAAGDADGARGRMLEAGDAAQRRGLAAAGGAEQHHDLAGRHGKADAGDRGPADRELLVQVADFEGAGHQVMPFTSPRSGRGLIASPDAIQGEGAIRESECVASPPHPKPALRYGFDLSPGEGACVEVNAPHCR